MFKKNVLVIFMFLSFCSFSVPGYADFLLGLKGVSENDPQPRKSLEESFAQDLPAKFDWRSHEGRDWLLPVRDQGRCGSCVAFAAASAFSAQWNISTKTLGWSFSPQYLFSCGGGSCVNGWFVEKALKDLTSWGTPDEACFPYLSGIAGERVACGTCKDGNARRRAATDYYQVGSSIINTKRAIMSGPILSTMKVYQDFYRYKGGVYKYSEGSFVGGHAVVIIGWDDADRVWIVRNSWGSQWGDHGDFRIPWDDRSAVGVKTFAISVDPRGKQLSISGLADGERIMEPRNISLGFTGFEPKQMKILVLKDETEFKSFDINSTSFTIDPFDFPQGRYLIQAVARDGETEMSSHAKIVTMSHGDLAGHIRFQGSNLDKPLNLDEDIEVAAEFSPILPEKLRFLIKDIQGKVMKDRTTTELGERTIFHMATRDYANGKYILEIEAYENNRLLAKDTKEIEIKNRLLEWEYL